MNIINNQTKPICAFLIATDDPSNAFSKESLESFSDVTQKSHTTVFSYMQNADIREALQTIKANHNYAPITDLFICAHGNPNYITFAPGESGIYDYENIRAQDFHTLEIDATIHFHSCSAAEIAKKTCLLTHRTTTAPVKPAYKHLSILLRTKKGKFNLTHYDRDLSILTRKFRFTSLQNHLLEVATSQPSVELSFKALQKEALLKEHSVALQLLGQHHFKGVQTEKNQSAALLCFYQSASKGNTNARCMLEMIASDSSDVIAYFYLALLHLKKPSPEIQIQGYQYLSRAAKQLHPAALNLFNEKIKSNDPLALFCAGKHCEEEGSPIFLIHYLKAALLGYTRAYFCLLDAYKNQNYSEQIRGKAALYAGYYLESQNELILAHRYFTKAAELHQQEGAEKALSLKECESQATDLQKRAKEEDPEAIFILANQASRASEIEEAVQLYKKLVEKGFAQVLPLIELCQKALQEGSFLKTWRSTLTRASQDDRKSPS